MAVVYAGLSLGPLAAGGLVTLWGWRAVFAVGAAVILLGFAVVAPLLGRRWRSPRGAVHLPSAGLVLASSLLLTLGSAWLRLGAVGAALLLVGVALAAWFVLLQRRLPRPLLDLRLLAANAPLRSALAVQLVLYLNAYCSMFLVSLFTQVVLGRPPAAAGGVLALSGIVMAIVSPLAGALGDRLRPRPLTVAGAVLVAASALVARTLDAGATLWSVRSVLVLQGLGFGLFSSPNMARIMGCVGRDQSGTVSALAAKARSVGMVTGMVLTQSLLSLQFGAAAVAEHPERLDATVTTIYTALAVTATLAAALAWRSRDDAAAR